MSFDFYFSSEILFLFDRSKIGNLSKMWNLTILTKTPSKTDKCFPFTK